MNVDRHGDFVRRADRFAADGQQGEAVSGANLVDAAQGLQL